MTYPIDQSIKSEQPRTELELRVERLEERVEALEQAQRDRIVALQEMADKLIRKNTGSANSHA
jgi:chaperonin cofactor prefoldin